MALTIIEELRTIHKEESQKLADAKQVLFAVATIDKGASRSRQAADLRLAYRVADDILANGKPSPWPEAPPTPLWISPRPTGNVREIPPPRAPLVK